MKIEEIKCDNCKKTLPDYEFVHSLFGGQTITIRRNSAPVGDKLGVDRMDFCGTPCLKEFLTK